MKSEDLQRSHLRAMGYTGVRDKVRRIGWIDEPYNSAVRNEDTLH